MEERRWRAAGGRHPWRLLAVVLAALALAACGNRGGGPPTGFEITVIAGESINPNADNDPSPVVVRLYELKSDQAFRQAEFFQLFDEDQKTLGADMLSREEFEFAPGTTQRITRRSQNPDLAYVGVLAAFRDIEAANWRAVGQVTPQKPNLVTITLSALSVNMQVERKRALGVF